MHIVEAFATSCGLKINRPYIFEKFYPLNFENYIIIESNDQNYQAKNYDYWQEVINLLSDILKNKNIKILQMCGMKDQKLINAYTISGFTTNQKAYLIKNSLLYAGSNLYGLQLASNYNIKILGLFGNIYSNLNKPYWSNEKDIRLLSPFNEKLKPSFFSQENPKAINRIKPDEIARNILNLLNIDNNLKHRFIEIGQHYNNKTIEVVPNMVVDPNSLNVPNIISRMDIQFNEKNLEEQLKQSKCLIVTNRKISEDLLKKYKNQIVQIVYEVNENNNPEFISLIKSLNINFVMMSYLEQQEINKFKINYMDFGLIIKMPETQKIQDSNIKYYKSNHFILSRNKLYMSEAAEAKDLPIRDFNQNIQNIIDSEMFWKHKENYAFLG